MEVTETDMDDCKNDGNDIKEDKSERMVFKDLEFLAKSNPELLEEVDWSFHIKVKVD